MSMAYALINTEASYEAEVMEDTRKNWEKLLRSDELGIPLV
ncbi:unnamed protein product [marine sediment metagenome]|uniref:Uncharacterized protein n=1 Tax=marine sediment metagenome TaxID=412755 RepID=X1VMF0_9ZZZZ